VQLRVVVGAVLAELGAERLGGGVVRLLALGARDALRLVCIFCLFGLCVGKGGCY
jgi:hypothetical protein